MLAGAGPRQTPDPACARREQDSGDYAGYEQKLQQGFDKAVRAPKKVRASGAQACYQARVASATCAWVATFPTKV